MMMMMKKKNRQQASELCREEELFGKSQGGLESQIETSRGRKEGRKLECRKEANDDTVVRTEGDAEGRVGRTDERGKNNKWT